MADDENEDMEEEVVSSGGTSKILMIIILVFGLAVGGGVAFFVLTQSGGDPEGEALDAEESAQEEIVKKEPKFVLFEGMAVPVHDSRGKYIGNYKITIKVLTENDNNNVKVRNAKFELRHAFISRIAKGGFLMPNSTSLDYEKTANVLKEISKSLVGDDLILGVVIEDAMRVNN